MEPDTNDRRVNAIAVLLVTSEHCHFCEQAKEILTRIDAEFPVPIEVAEVSMTSTEGRALAAAHGILFPPGVFIDGIYAGFGRPSRRLLKILGHRLQERSASPAGAGR